VNHRAEELARRAERHPAVTVGDLAEWSHLPLLEALRAYDSKRFWANVERASARVDTWPAWKKGIRMTPATRLTPQTSTNQPKGD
jgi:hypothetical protein